MLKSPVFFSVQTPVHTLSSVSMQDIEPKFSQYDRDLTNSGLRSRVDG
jgi:hypothetical protein